MSIRNCCGRASRGTVSTEGKWPRSTREPLPRGPRALPAWVSASPRPGAEAAGQGSPLSEDYFPPFLLWESLHLQRHRVKARSQRWPWMGGGEGLLHVAKRTGHVHKISRVRSRSHSSHFRKWKNLFWRPRPTPHALYSITANAAAPGPVRLVDVWTVPSLNPDVLLRGNYTPDFKDLPKKRKRECKIRHG